MQRGREHKSNAKQAGDELEPYRRLLEIQKQLVEMAEQHEQTKRECAALREQVAREMLEPRRWKTDMRRLQRSAARLLRRLSRGAPKTRTAPSSDSNTNQNFPC